MFDDAPVYEVTIEVIDPELEQPIEIYIGCINYTGWEQILDSESVILNDLANGQKVA